MCRLEPQGRQEEAEVVILGDLLEDTEPKALPPAKKQSLQGQQKQELEASTPALEKTALESYQEEFSQKKFTSKTPIEYGGLFDEFSIVRKGRGILEGGFLSGDVYGDGIASIIISNKNTADLDKVIEELKKEDKLKEGDLLAVAGSTNKSIPELSMIRVTKSGYEIKQPTEKQKAEHKLRSALIGGAMDSEVEVDTLFTPSQEDINTAARYRKLEEKRFAQLEKIHPRTPTSKKIDSNTYRKRAEEFAKELGLPASANNFSDLQTRMHDIAHPVMYDMLGLSPKDIQKFFGTTGLVAEEALVNALEQMSRGAYPRAAATNGIMLARVLSRGTETASAYRNSEFSAKVEFLVNKMFQNPDLYRYLKVVRKANRISKTVTVAADM